MYFPYLFRARRVWLGVCLLLCLCALPWPTHAGVLLAVVSERAAPTALAAAPAAIWPNTPRPRAAARLQTANQRANGTPGCAAPTAMLAVAVLATPRAP